MDINNIGFILATVVPAVTVIGGIFFLMYMFNLDSKKDKKKI